MFGLCSILEMMHRPALLLICCALAGAAQENSTAIRDQAIALVAQGKYAEAEPLLARVLAAREGSLGAEDPDLIPCVRELAALYRAQGRNGEPAELYLRAVKIREKASGVLSLDLIPDLKVLGAVYTSMQRIPDAEKQYIRAV